MQLWLEPTFSVKKIFDVTQKTHKIFCIIVGKNKTIEVYNNLHNRREISISVFDRSLTEHSICRAQKKKKKHVNRSEPLDS